MPAAASTAQAVPTEAPRQYGRTGLTREAVDSALAASGGNKAKAAKLLGVGRATLYRFFDREKG